VGPRDADDKLSQLLDGTPYRATRTLGRGGMGVVVEAMHTQLGKRFAVKLLSPPSGAPVTAFEEDRLRVEAQALANIASSNVVSVHAIGRTGAGQLYVVMDLLQGHSLADELAERGRFPVEEALSIARDALVGLQSAHQLGVVHRDIKPANLFLVRQPSSARGYSVKVLDFGVAKITEVAQRGGIDAPVIPTQDGYFMGTPRFFSPEHVVYGPFDARTDVYGIGLVLYITLTGRGPFDEETGLSAFALAAATFPPPPPSRFAPDRVDAALDALILRALEKRPDARYADAEAFIQAIDLYLARDRAEPPARQADVPQLRTEPLGEQPATLPRPRAARRRVAPPARARPKLRAAPFLAALAVTLLVLVVLVGWISLRVVGAR